MSSNKVKLSNSLVSKLIGEGGKKISEICRDTKTQISVAPLKPDSGNVLIVSLNYSFKMISTRLSKVCFSFPDCFW